LSIQSALIRETNEDVLLIWKVMSREFLAGAIACIRDFVEAT
jgi:hypothetical protein